MSGAPPPTRRRATAADLPPRIAILYAGESVPLLTIRALAARGVVDPVWVTDGEDARILRRFGTVVRAEGRSDADLAAELRTLGVAGVVTFADSRIERTAALAGMLGLPGNSASTARRLVDKTAQRRALADAGVAGPAFVGITERADVDAQDRRLNALRYPVVLKPAMGSGGRDTHAVADVTALRSQLDRRRRGDSWEPLIVEECLGDYPPTGRAGFGDYVSAEVVVVGGTPTVMAVTGRMPLSEPFRETGAFLPSTLSRHEQSEIVEVAVAAARALDVTHGCLHTEIKLTAMGPQIIEVNGRVPGGGIADLVGAFVGVDLYEHALCAALGRRPGPRLEHLPPSSTGGVHYQLALQPPIGIPVRLVSDWSRRLRATPGLGDVTLRAEEADVDLGVGSYGYLLLASGEAVDHGSLLATYRLLNDLVVQR